MFQEMKGVLMTNVSILNASRVTELEGTDNEKSSRQGGVKNCICDRLKIDEMGVLYRVDVETISNVE
jgi:hypothetical protein